MQDKLSSNSIHVSIESLGQTRSFPIHKHNGTNYVELEKGCEYVICIHNSRYGRKLAVVSVDGLDVLDGEPASRTKNGYVFNNSLVIDGWRVSDNDVRKFKVSPQDESYSEKAHGHKKNIGVIGIIVFSEKEVHAVYCSSVLRSKSGAGGQSAGIYEQPTSGAFESKSPKSLGSKQLGTAMGERQESKVTHTTFDKHEVQAEFVLHYKTRQQLIELGVITDQPNPFPADSNYCKEV